MIVYYSAGCTNELFKTTCGCAKANIKPQGPSGKKLTCYPIDVNHFLQTVHFPDDVIWIDFSGNHEEQLSELTFGTNEHVLKYLLNVYRLDFSNNGIWKISPNTFLPVRNLTRLNLSHNNIGNLTQGMFNGLSRLEVLDLSFNKFPIIPGYAFKSLRSLQKVYLRSTNLVCNCLMKDFVIWLKARETTTKAIGTCHLPKDGVRLRKLDPHKLICSISNITLPYFGITPSKPQLVVQGDRIDIQCEGTNLPNSQLYWSLNETRLLNESELFSFTTSINHYRSIITGWLTVKNVTTAHTGLWNCTVESPYGKSTRSTRWTVINSHAQYCKEDTVVNNHGAFSWPATVEGLSKNVHCGGKGLFATRLCLQGGWANGDYIDCPFNNFVTNEIHTALIASSVSQSKANLLMNLMATLGDQPITEKLALDFLNKIVIKRMRSLTITEKDKIGQALLNLGSYIMKTNVSLLRQAESRYSLCKNIIEFIKNRNIKLKTPAVIEEESENIAIRAVNLDEKSQLTSEMMCAISENKVKLQVFCQAAATQRQQSSILLPQTVLNTCTITSGAYKIYFIAYRNGKLFQHTSLSRSVKGNLTIPVDVSSEMVFQVDIYGCTPKNLSDPIVFNFLTKDKGSHYPAVWTSDGWRKDDACSAVCISKNFTQVVCYKFATVTLIYDHDSDADGTENWSLTSSTHPAILAATIILTVCLLIVMVHYRFYAESLHVDKESRHMILNICFHMLMAACLFAFCVRLGSNRSICVICGIILHYASLAVLFWITLSVRNIQRQLITLTKPPSLEPRPPKPMLRFYLIGWGIPLIICGITAAAKVENYGVEKKYCWLTWETSIYAFYLPAAFVAVVCIFYLLRVLCTFNQQSIHFGSNRSPVIGHSWQQDKRINNTNNHYQAISASEPCHCSEFLNHSRADGPNHHHHPSCPLRPTEQSFKSRVTGTAVLFVLYLFTWVAAALAVAVPTIQPTVSVNHPCMKKNEEHSHQQIFDAFSWLYAALAISIGVFALVQSLLLRKTCRSRFLKFLDRDNSHDNDARSLSSVSKREHLDDVNLDHLTSSNDKSLPTGNKKHRGYPTIKTDPTSETMLESTDVAENFVADSAPPYQDLFLKSHWNNGLAENCEPCIIHGNNRIANSASSLQKSYTRGQYSHNDSRSHAMDSARRAQFSHHHHSHDVCRMDPRGYRAGALPYHHIGYHNHHVSHHHDHGKVMKMTNLHMAHDSSMTDHSLDDAAFNNMHTVPVIMQNHTQAKVNNSAMVDRYQKMRRALEKKRARQRKLNVLREYAQDPLTSNDESRDPVQSNSDSKCPNESIPLVGGISDADAARQSDNQRFRPLLLSPPAHKKSETNDKNRSRGPNKRVKRLGLSSQMRSGNRSKRRKSRNSISSEKEQDTMSSKNYQDGFMKAVAEKSPLLIHPLEGDPVSVISQSSALKGQGVHGYLTLQQFQTAGGFLFPSRNIPLTETLPATRDLTLPAAIEQGHANTIESSQIEPQTNETTL